MNTRVAQWVLDLIAYDFTPDQLEVIGKHWYRYWQGNLTNSDKQDLVNTGHTILVLTNSK